MSAPHAGVLGRPIAHSLSPVLHRAAYAALGLDWTYDAIDCGVDDLAGVLAERSDWAGFSATMPLKHALLDVAAEVRPTAAAVGAANTLLPGPDGWIADNTDVHGIVATLREHGRPDAGTTTATLLGAGGTAQAAIVALHRLGIDRCDVFVRDPSRASALIATADRLGTGLRVTTFDREHGDIEASRLVISTLPAGAADPFAHRSWSAEQTVLDVVYSPWPTPLATAAAAGGAIVLSGALMLLHQAGAQLDLMTGQRAPIDAMRAALASVAPGCGV